MQSSSDESNTRTKLNSGSVAYKSARISSCRSEQNPVTGLGRKGLPEMVVPRVDSDHFSTTELMLWGVLVKIRKKTALVGSFGKIQARWGVFSGKQSGASLNSKDTGKAGMQMQVEPESGFVREMIFGK